MGCVQVVKQLPAIDAGDLPPFISASPGFQFGRPGDIFAGTYLLGIGSVPSNSTGIPCTFDGNITRVYVGNENANTFDIEIQRRDAGPVYTTLLTVSMAAIRSAVFDVSVAVAEGDELCARVSSGTCRNVQVGVIIL